MAKDEQTTKFKVDISQLKKEFQEAQRHIRLVNSEFKAATAGMDNWANNADGLSAKITQLNGVLDAEKSKLKSLESQYALVVKEQGENSKGAQELMIKINNQKASVERVSASIKGYTDKLNNLQTESNQTESAAEKLANTIKQQESDLKALKAKYAGLILEQGKSSKEAKETAAQIKKLSSSLNQNKATFAKAEDATDDFDRTLQNVDDSAEQVAEGFTVMKGALADLLADGIRSVIDGLKDFVVESDGAYKKFQAQTGASAEEMEKFSEQMDDIYKSGIGDTLEDIGDKMAYVKQVTGEVDPTKIKKLTENAIALEDTFGSDFNETIRGVSNLMTHFGIDANEAFDLFAKGSQEGLDYTSELGDNIAEYGGNFKQAGYSAEEYFQLLANGSKNGAYNLDKVNDSINEVKNRLGDGTIEKNIKLFSDGTKDAFKAWKKGKGTMKDVIDSIVDDINNCENEQEALTMAATAFGTMGEDANLKVVKSLKSTGKTFKDVKGSMEDVKKVKYDDVATQFKQLGRTIQLDVIAPLAEDALPTAKEFINWTKDNLNSLIPIAKAAGLAIAAIFTVNKTAQTVSSIKLLIDIFKSLKVSITAAAAQSTLLSAALTALPFVAVGAAIVGVTLAMKHYSDKQTEAIQAEYGLSEAQKESIKNAKDLKTAYEDTDQARRQATAAVTSEYNHLNELKSELNGLIDSNGKVKKGYEDRANFIVTELANALGLEKDKIWEIIESNGELGDSIDQIIQKKQAEATLNANESAYTEAIQKRSEALNTYQSSLETLKSAEEKYNETKDEANKIMAEYDEFLKESPEAAAAYYNFHHKLIEQNETAKDSYEKAKKGVEDAESAYVGYNTTIQNYEGLSAAIISGDAAKIQDALQNMQTNFITAENGTKASLERQVKNMQQNYESLKQAIDDNTPGVTQAMVDQAAEMVKKSKAELDKLPPEASESGKNAGTSAAKGLESTAKYNETAGALIATSQNTGLASADTNETGKDKATQFKDGAAGTVKMSLETGKTLSSNLNTGLGSANTKDTGSTKGSQYAGGANSQSGIVKSTGVNLSSSLNSGLNSANTNSTGAKKTGEFNSGVKSIDTYTPGKNRAEDAKSGMASVSADNTGSNFVSGFINGMAGMASSLWDTAWDLGKKALNALSSAIKEGSPSRETAKSGRWFVLGFANEIADMSKVAIKQAQILGQQTVQAMNDELNTDVKMPVISAGVSAARNAVRNGSSIAGQTGKSTQVNNTYNFYQTNNSPKSLSRLEIYRQTKNQLNFAKGV